jgi:hypothetical protein
MERIMDTSSNSNSLIFPQKEDRYQPWPDLLTEAELICYLRIPEVSRAKNYRHAIDNLKRFHDLPRIHICGQPLYPKEAIQDWIRKQTEKSA